MTEAFKCQCLPEVQAQFLGAAVESVRNRLPGARLGKESGAEVYRPRFRQEEIAKNKLIAAPLSYPDPIEGMMADSGNLVDPSRNFP